MVLLIPLSGKNNLQLQHLRTILNNISILSSSDYVEYFASSF